MSTRLLLPVCLTIVALTVIVFTVRQGQIEPADFTFANETEIESLDPAVVTGQPEGRILWAIYEGLVRQNPETLQPIPGVAEEWNVSEDGKTYTFKLRKNAKWSNGDPVTSRDFVYGMRRFLDPMTAAEYSYQAWYIKNAKRYSSGARSVEIGEKVEIELHELPVGALPFARGIVLRGTLKAVNEDDVEQTELDDPEKYLDYRTFTVEIDGKEQVVRVTPEKEELKGELSAKQLLLDFSEVGFSAPDEYTVVTELESPAAFWLQLLGFYPLSPVHQETVETYGKPEWTYAENIVTNGAYQVQFRRLRDRIRLRKNPHYWDRENVELEVIDALAVQSEITAFNLYETGQVDWITKVPALIASELLKRDPVREDLNPAPMLTSYYYVVNCERPPLDNVKVRKALTLALDRNDVVRTAGAGEQAARNLVPPGLPGYESPKCEPHNVEAARKLLAEAGFPDGAGFPKVEILYNTHENHQTIAEIIRKQWQRNLGINVAIRNEEWSTYDSSLRQKEFDIARRAWGGDYLDPNTFLDMWVTGGENNDAAFSNKEYDRLIEEAKFELDPEKRLELLRQAEEIIVSELPIIPIYFYVSRNLVRPQLQGLYNNVLDQHPLWALSIDPNAKRNDYMRPPSKVGDAQ